MFERLVPGNYELVLEKKYNGASNSTISLPVKLKGEDRGAGNGPYVPEKTLLPNGTVVESMAGHKADIRVILRN